MNNENTETSTFFDELKACLLPRLAAAQVSNAQHVAELVIGLIERNYAGQSVYIPKNGTEYKRKLEERNRKIAMLHREGCSVSEIASQFRLSRSHVSEIVGSFSRSSDT